jgi:hypothetical protein
LAELPRLVHAPIKDHDVRVAAQQDVGVGRSNPEQDAPDSRHDLALGLTYGCGLWFQEGIRGQRSSARYGHERVGRQRCGKRSCPGQQLATVHVLIRPDGHDRGNP